MKFNLKNKKQKIISFLRDLNSFFLSKNGDEGQKKGGSGSFKNFKRRAPLLFFYKENRQKLKEEINALSHSAYLKYIKWLRSSDIFSMLLILLCFSLLLAYITIPKSFTANYPTEESMVNTFLAYPVRADKDYTIVDKEKTMENREKAQAEVPNNYAFEPKSASTATKAFLLMQNVAKESIKKEIGASRADIPPEFQDLAVQAAVSSGKDGDPFKIKTNLNRAFREKREDFQNKIGFPVSDDVFNLLSDNLFPLNIALTVEKILSHFNTNNYYILREGIPQDYFPSHILVKNNNVPISVPKTKIISNKTLKQEIFHAMTKFNPGEFTPQALEIIAEIALWSTKDNIVYNIEATENKKMEARNNAAKSEIKYRNGDLIKSAGALITEKDIKIFKLMKEQAATVSVWQIFFRNFFYIIFFAAILYFTFKRSVGKFHCRNKDLLLIGCQLTLSLFLFLLMPNIQSYVNWQFGGDSRILYFLIPIPFAGTLIKILINTETSCFFLFLLSSLFLLIFPNNFYFPIFYTIGTLFFMLILTHVEQIGQIFKLSFLLAAVLIVGVVMIFIMDPSLKSEDLSKAMIYAGAGSILSGILLISMITFYEWGFDYVSNMKLIGYSTMSHQLIKLMSVKANGTYQHSLTVASMVEIAAQKIGINSLACKIMAYFHDVGKLAMPEYFTENQRGFNPHDKNSYSMSAKIILNHVKKGREYAQKYHLGEEIENAIAEHHGTTLIGYFYKKAKEEDPNVSKAEFKYLGPKPQSKETALLMIADSCEAAVRSMSDRNYQKISAKVGEIIAAKNEEEQFSECDLSTSDMQKIKQSLIETLTGIYHTRIKYPNQKE